MDLKIFILSIVTIINFSLSVLIYFHRRTKLEVVYSLFAFSVSIWALTNALFQVVNNLDVVFWLAIMSYFSAVFIAVTFYYFSLLFSQINFTLKPRKKYLLVLSTTLIFIIVLFPNLVIKNIVNYGEYKVIETGQGLTIYFVYFLFLTILAFVNLFRKYPKVNQNYKQQLKLIIGGTLFAAIFGIIFNLALPLLRDYRFVWLGPNFTVIMVASIAYAASKYHLFNIKLIAAELFTGAIWITLLVQIFGANTPLQLSVSILIFLASVIFGILLIRSILIEIRQKEKLAKMTKQLKKTNEKLKELDQLKTDFVSMVTHQLRSPLTVVKGYSSMLSDGSFGPLNKEEKNASQTIFESTERLISFVNDILDLNRLEQGRMEFNFEDLQIEDVVKSVFEELEPKAKEKNLEYKLEMPKTEFPKVSVDKLKIRQVIFNVLDNSVKYTPKGQITVSTEYDKELHLIKIKIKDSGMGMSQEEIPHIFEKFKRTKATEKSKIKGSGMGLYIAREIVRKHEGDITAESKGKGEGSVFTIILPARI